MRAERFTLDSNVLVYSIDRRDPVKHAAALVIVEAAAALDCPLALQATGEFCVAAMRKLRLPAVDVKTRAGFLLTGFESFAYDASAIAVALEEAARSRFSFWDAVLLASSAQAGCTVILSEDMQDGSRFGSITVSNPFAAEGLSDAARETLRLA